jgi:hypothetical protein
LGGRKGVKFAEEEGHIIAVDHIPSPPSHSTSPPLNQKRQQQKQTELKVQQSWNKHRHVVKDKKKPTDM